MRIGVVGRGFALGEGKKGGIGGHVGEEGVSHYCERVTFSLWKLGTQY